MMWLTAIIRSLLQIVLFAFRGGLTNACAGAVEGVVAAAAWWPIAVLMKQTPMNFFAALCSGLLAGCWVGWLAGFAGLGLAACLHAVRPRDEDWDAAFHRLYVSLLWGGILCLSGSVCSFFLLAMVYKTLPGVLRELIEQWMFHGLVGSYVLGSVVGALAPGMPLWVLQRLGEVYGRTRLLFQGKSL